MTTWSWRRLVVSLLVFCYTWSSINAILTIVEYGWNCWILLMSSTRVFHLLRLNTSDFDELNYRDLGCCLRLYYRVHVILHISDLHVTRCWNLLLNRWSWQLTDWFKHWRFIMTLSPNKINFHSKEPNSLKHASTNGRIIGTSNQRNITPTSQRHIINQFQGISKAQVE